MSNHSRFFELFKKKFSNVIRIESASPGESEAGPPAPARSDISVDSIERSGLAVGGNGTAAFGGEKWERGQTRWLEELRATGAKIVQVTYPRTANNDKELSVIRGEYLQVNLLYLFNFLKVKQEEIVFSVKRA